MRVLHSRILVTHFDIVCVCQEDVSSCMEASVSCQLGLFWHLCVACEPCHIMLFLSVVELASVYFFFNIRGGLCPCCRLMLLSVILPSVFISYFSCHCMPLLSSVGLVSPIHLLSSLPLFSSGVFMVCALGQVCARV